MSTQERESETMAAFGSRISLAAAVEQTDRNPNMDEGRYPMDHWRVRLSARIGGKVRRLTTTFSMGSGHEGRAPEAVDVLDCLLSDAGGYENAKDFADWCAEYGYDTDSRKAERTFRVIERQSRRVRALLGDEYEHALWHVERL